MGSKKLKQFLILVLYVFLVKLIFISMLSYTTKLEEKKECNKELKEKIHKPFIKKTKNECTQ